jgi:hypothetical protein
MAGSYGWMPRPWSQAGHARPPPPITNLALLVALLVAFAAITAVVRAAGLPGASRRFTASYEAGSFDPVAMPTTSWIDDVAPEVDPATWRLVVTDADGERQLSVSTAAKTPGETVDGHGRGSKIGCRG